MHRCLVQQLPWAQMYSNIAMGADVQQLPWVQKLHVSIVSISPIFERVNFLMPSRVLLVISRL